MIVVITGGTGYVGRHVAAQCLANGWQVHLLTRVGSDMPAMLEGRVVRHDTDGSVATMMAVLKEAAPNCVLHLASGLAGVHNTDQVERLVEANISFPTRLLEAMRGAGVQNLINTGTFWQHYRGASYWPVDFYAATKQAFEDLLRHYTDLHGITAITLKLYDNYGPSDPRRKIVTGLVEAALSGNALEMSPGDQILDLTHVADLGTAFVIAARLACEAPGGSNRVFFVSGERMPLKELVSMIADRSPQGLNIAMGTRPYRVREIMDPIAPGEWVVPGWRPEHRVADTIDALLRSG